MALSCSFTVSYTHLPDLYGVGEFPALVVYGHSRQVAIGGVESVSYTHLDVYKRQDIFIRRLEGLEQEIGVWHDVHERAEEYGQLALAWREAGEVERGKSLVPLLLRGSFGIYHHKDRQLQQWVDLFTKAAEYQPNLVNEDIGRFSSALVVLEQAGRGRGTQDAAIELLALAMSATPGYAKTLFDWLLDHGGLHFSSAVSGLLLGALRHESPPLEAIFVVARHLLIPFDSYVYEPLAEQLAERTSQCASTEIAERLMSELILAIQILSLIHI